MLNLICILSMIIIMVVFICSVIKNPSTENVAKIACAILGMTILIFIVELILVALFIIFLI